VAGVQHQLRRRGRVGFADWFFGRQTLTDQLIGRLAG
jgi:hypothetical protein